MWIKNFRIRTGLEPVITQGRLFLLEASTEAWIELRGFPTAATKDVADAIESCIRLAPMRPISKQKDAEFEQYAKYLRSTKLSPHLIQQKLEAFKAGEGGKMTTHSKVFTGNWGKGFIKLRELLSLKQEFAQQKLLNYDSQNSTPQGF